MQNLNWSQTRNLHRTNKPKQNYTTKLLTSKIKLKIRKSQKNI